MASSSNDLPKEEHVDDVQNAAELAKVWADLLKGEKTAETLEKSLTPLEKKIDDLLASLEAAEQLKSAEPVSKDVQPEAEGSGDAKGKP